MKHLLSLLCIASYFLCSLLASPAESDIIKAEVAKVRMALQNGEIEFLLNHTHDNVISLMGGREKAHSYLMNFHKQMKAKNMDLGAITFPSEPIFISGTAHDFVIVQTKAMLALNNKDIKSLHFQFGAKKKGTKHWKYLDGSKLNKAVLKSWFPDFPKHTSLPKNIKEILQRA